MNARRQWLGLTAAAAAVSLWPGRAGAARPAERVVCAGGALSETVCALGLQSLLVGVDTTSTFPAALGRLPSIGYARALSAEGILSLAPTRLLATDEAGPPAVLRQIAAAGVAVELLPSRHRFEGVVERVRQVGSLLGQPARAAALAERLQRDWTQVRGAIVARPKAPPPRVLFMMSHASTMVAGRDTAAQAMLDYAGVSNAIDGFSGYRPLTPEGALLARPDLILTTEPALKAAGGAAGLLRQPGLADTPAARAGRVVAMETMLLLGFGPRLPEALRQLDAALRRSLA